MSTEVSNSCSTDSEPYRVLLVCRSSGESDGREQEALLRDWLAHNITTPVDVSVVHATNGRALHAAARDALQSAPRDFIFVTSLDRITRGIGRQRFLNLAAWLKTRVIALRELVDTAEPDGRLKEILAAPRYETYSECLSRRIRRGLSRRRK